MSYAQYFLLLLATLNFFRSLYIDVNGRSAKPASGFEGIVSTIISTGMILLLYYFTGAFSQIF